jgi:hypothetical protein
VSLKDAFVMDVFHNAGLEFLITRINPHVNRFLRVETQGVVALEVLVNRPEIMLGTEEVRHR